MSETRASGQATRAELGEQNAAAAILTAAAVEFDRFGFESTSFASIASRADMSKSLVSYHFPTKALLAAGVVKYAYRGGIFMMDAAPECDGLSSLPVAAALVADALLHNPLARAAVRLRLHPEVQDFSIPSPYLGWLVRIREVLSHTQQSAQLSDSLDVDREARLMVSTFVGLANVAMSAGDTFNLAGDIAVAIGDRVSALRR